MEYCLIVDFASNFLRLYHSLQNIATFDNLCKFILENVRGQLTRSIFEIPVFILQFHLTFCFKLKLNIYI